MTETKKATWSVPRIKHPKFPQFGAVRLAEFPTRGDPLYLFFQQVKEGRGRQVMRGLGKACGKDGMLFRRDLGRTESEQVKEAKRRACEFIEAQATPPPAPPEALPFAQLAEAYERDGFAGRAPLYKRDALAVLRRFAAFVGSDKAITELKPTDVERFIAHRHAQGVTASARGDVDAVKIACNWAVERAEILMASPFLKPGFKKVMPKRTARHQPVASLDRYEKLREKASKLPPMFAVVLDVAWHTGHRIGTMRMLKWNDVMLTATETAPYGTITWYRGVVPDRKKHEHRLPINEGVAATLRRWQKATRGVGEAWVFTAPTDPTKPVRYDVVKKWLRTAERKAKLAHEKHGGWHMFRRGWATARKDLPVQDVAAGGGGGEDSASLRQCYQHATEEQTLDVALRLVGR